MLLLIANLPVVDYSSQVFQKLVRLVPFVAAAFFQQFFNGLDPGIASALIAIVKLIGHLLQRSKTLALSLNILADILRATSLKAKLHNLHEGLIEERYVSFS